MRANTDQRVRVRACVDASIYERLKKLSEEERVNEGKRAKGGGERGRDRRRYEAMEGFMSACVVV